MLSTNFWDSPRIFQVLYVLCFTRPRYQVSIYRTIGPLVFEIGTVFVQGRRPPLVTFSENLSMSAQLKSR